MNTVTIEVASRKQSDARFARAIFERTDDVGIVFPCDAVHVDFMLHRARSPLDV